MRTTAILGCCLSFLGCGGSGSSGPAGGQPAAVAPADGRCALTPHMLVSQSSLPGVSDSGSVTVSVDTLVAGPSNLYYVVDVLQVGVIMSVYTAGSLMSVPLAGGASTMLASGYLFGVPVLTATSLLVPELNAYPNQGTTGIVSFPLVGGPATTIVDSGFVGSPTSLATDGTNLYFADDNGIQIAPISPAADAGTSSTMIAPGMTECVGVFGQRLLFVEPPGDVKTIPLPAQPGAVPTVIGTSDPGAYDLFACGSDACWIDDGAGAVARIDPAGGTVTRLFTPETARFAVFDGAHFFVMISAMSQGEVTGATSLVRMDADGTHPSVLVTMPRGNALAVDDECVYWSNPAGVFSLAKSAQGPISQ